MQNLKILNSKEIKKIHSMLNENFGFEEKLDYGFLANNKNKIYIINKDFADIDIEKIRINSLGLYLGETYDNDIRLSIEGSQIIGKKAKKNVVELDKQETKDWLRGIDIEKETGIRGFIILKHNTDFLGCGKAVDKKILNFVPKNRRLKVND